MDFATPLIPGRLVKRYKRFLADIVLHDGREITAHCPNPGGMIGLNMPGLPAYVSLHDVPSRKLKHTLELVRLPHGGPEGTLVGINTAHPNRLVEEAIRSGAMAELAGYPDLRREVRYGVNSRVDLLLSGHGRPDCYVEVKNVHLTRLDGPHPTAAEFPDAVTARGLKHLHELTAMVAAGHRAVMVYLVQRADNDHFRLAQDIDPAYAAGLRAAIDAGVEAICYACHVGLESITVERPLPILV